MSLYGVGAQLLALILAVLGAPLLTGWVNQCRAWLQNRSGAGVWQPYRVLNKLFHKDVVLAHNASPLFRSTPYILFGCMWLAAGIVPVLATDLPFAPAADIIAGHVTTDAEAARRFARAILASTSAAHPAPAPRSAATTTPDTAVSPTTEAAPSGATTFPMEDAAPGTEPPK